MHQKAFTLIELLIVIGIIAILSAAVVITINPTERLREARDATRVTDIDTLNKSLSIFESQNPSASFGTASTVYISIPDTSTSCANLGLDSLPSGYSYHCVSTSTLQNVDGTGWLPVNFASQGILALSALPIDPTNTTSSNFFYSYTPGSWELDATMESEKYQTTAANDGGDVASIYEKGLALSLIPATISGWVCGDTITDTRDSKTYNTVLIGSQCWMAQYINVGTKIAGTSNQTNNTTLEKYCFDNSEANCTSDGGLYQWDEAMQYSASCNGSGAPPNDACATPVQGICPDGWHIPSHYELTTLERNVGSNPSAFPYDITTTGWLGTNEGTNLKVGGTSGFEGILAGYRSAGGSFSIVRRAPTSGLRWRVGLVRGDATWVLATLQSSGSHTVGLTGFLSAVLRTDPVRNEYFSQDGLTI